MIDICVFLKLSFWLLSALQLRFNIKKHYEYFKFLFITESNCTGQADFEWST